MAHTFRPARRTARAAAGAAMLVLPLSACSAGTSTSSSPSSRPSASAPGGVATGTAPTLAPDSPAPSGARVVRLVVAGGRVSGDTGRVPVSLGSTVRLEVTSDVADEVHVHTYDKKVDVMPGAPAVLQFTADIPAIVEVELESRSLLLTRLQVS